ncbi:hypothetical protein SAMN06265365_1393 [Tistlia consotensis]|uniref:Uncharacterized protein n=1 Tax=Tistlia consotensis USBA 355 TaxID=560819 RepID=A0A1Y6CPX4_9PROT|nr:hypothetical protein [Tistlia consotensis]SMF80744.1 hypothetical protein SAMN05428998_1423 [Tistlia consotensis USBA 355]SNS21496.1 hypothetical protein SAMN06265365_1393 [Tistlia consotensis]
MSASPYRRFWFRFAPLDLPTPLNLGCGVTAIDDDDALSLLTRRVFADGTLPTVVECIRDVDICTLDPGHVLPNMGVVAWRGVWFPLGYKEPD